MTDRRILVTGAAGFVGRALCAHLAERGWRVWAGVRREPDPVIKEAARYMFTDLRGPWPIEEIGEADACVHLAWDQRARTLARSRDVNVDGTRALVKAFSPAPGRPFVFVSSCSAHDDARSIYGRTKLEAEEIVRNAGGCVVRPGLVIGHGGLFGRLARAVASWPAIPLVDGGGQLFQVIAIGDLVEGVLRVIEDEPKETMILAGEERIELRALLETAAAAQRTQARFVSVPSRLVRPLLRVTDTLRLPAPVTEDNLQGLLDVPWQDPSETLEKLGLGLVEGTEAVREVFG